MINWIQYFIKHLVKATGYNLYICYGFNFDHVKYVIYNINVFTKNYALI